MVRFTNIHGILAVGTLLLISTTRIFTVFLNADDHRSFFFKHMF